MVEDLSLEAPRHIDRDDGADFVNAEDRVLFERTVLYVADVVRSKCEHKLFLADSNVSLAIVGSLCISYYDQIHSNILQQGCWRNSAYAMTLV